MGIRLLHWNSLFYDQTNNFCIKKLWATYKNVSLCDNKEL
jgi:hypothetical protein